MSIPETISFVQSAHGDQKYGNMPYIVHLMLVSRHFKDETRKTIALLHDVVEDTNITLDVIQRHWGWEIALAVDSITRRPEEEGHYLDLYIPRVGANALARDVKIADLSENIYSSENNFPAYQHLVPMYRKALSYLTGADHTSNAEYLVDADERTKNVKPGIWGL